MHNKKLLNDLYQIYNEMIRDLLQPGSGYLELREDSKGVQVSGLSSVSASSTREVCIAIHIYTINTYTH